MRTLDEIIAELFNMLEMLYLDGCLSDEERKLEAKCQKQIDDYLSNCDLY